MSGCRLHCVLEIWLPGMEIRDMPDQRSCILRDGRCRGLLRMTDFLYGTRPTAKKGRRNPALAAGAGSALLHPARRSPRLLPERGERRPLRRPGEGRDPGFCHLGAVSVPRPLFPRGGYVAAGCAIKCHEPKAAARRSPGEAGPRGGRAGRADRPVVQRGARRSACGTSSGGGAGLP
jgi:hypothetical protein